MPQAARASARAANTDKETSKAQEQEFKRARGAISCAECRRLKLKCDKTIPCSSCKRRGCASICPNGSLATGQGTRFILADTDRLHRKIEEMSDRIRHLEDALSILQSSTTREPHPLLRRDLLEIKSGLQLHSALQTNPETGEPQTQQEIDEQSQYIDAFGTLAVRDDGVATFYGRSAGSESLLLDEKANAKLPVPSSASSSPSPVAQLASTMFPLAQVATDTKLSPLEQQMQLEEYLPQWDRARALCDLYLEQAPWFFGAVTRKQLMEEIVPLFYPEANANARTTPADTPPAQDLSPSPSNSNSNSSTLTVATSVTAFNLSESNSESQNQATAHDLALIFVVFCFGALTDPQLNPAPDNEEANKYYELTRAALNLHPVFDMPPSVVTVQTLSLMGIYQGLVANENSIESTWSLMGMSCKLAQSIGLHRDCARWKLTPAEVQKRRALFWELFITDCWQGLATGRLPTFALPYVDTELPADPDETLADDGTPQPSFPAWKAMWGKECVSGVVEVTLQARAPKYSLILELDRKIRDTQLPKYAQGEPPKNASLSETMSHFMPINYRELTLLYVHRCFFAQALVDYPTDPMRSQYAPSFLAGYTSACALIGTVREQFIINPVQIARFWVLWTHAFSSTVMLASVVTHGGTTKTAQAALSELRLAHDLFEKASKYGGRAVKFLPIIRRLHDKAYQAFSQGYQQLRKDIFTPRDAQSDKLDELGIFSGRTRTVATKAAKPAPRPPKRDVSRRRISPGVNSPESAGSGSDSLRSSQSPAASASSDSPHNIDDVNLPSLESYGSSVHPMLVDGMRAFESSLDVQIYNAQQAFYLENASPEEARPMTGGSGRYGYAAPPPPPAENFQYHVEAPQEYEQPPPPVWDYQAEPAQPHTQPAMQAHETVYHVQPHDPHMQVYDQQHQHQQQHIQYQQPVDHPGQYNVAAYSAIDDPHAAQSYHYEQHPPAAPHTSAVPMQQEYAIMPQQAHEQPHVHSQLWHVPPQDTYPAVPPQQLQQPQYHSHDYGQSAPGSVPRMHGQGVTPVRMHQQQHQHQHQHHQYAPPPQPPPPPAPLSVLPVHTGSYSLQETWTSFMQQELPAPIAGPGSQRQPVYQSGGR